ncbi:replication factor C large subunit [Methanotorris formicicus]|uniref:Replication factor C large subunit n=1 Tax=Methanotorris formicicus Mc-S-70 TaxID=647171 RepID=H1L016_9EURY|nr:replication factor C large subunit [Methanotorris formicicus]EHP85314.1 AAA ATPase central domain protein [Methanotorris formicicus Mc-S-70]
MLEWVEKYRPKTLKEVAGHNEIKEKLKKWIEDHIKGKNPKPIILVGNPGCGKTTLAHALARDYGFDVIELNASDKRNRAAIRQIVGTASTSKSLTGKNILIILDEVDGISGTEDSGGVSEILKVIKEAKNPIILTANDIYKPTLKPLRDVCEVINVPNVHTNTILAVLKRIAKKENLDVDEKTLKIIAKHSGGDLRAAINDLEALALGGKINQEIASHLPDRDTERTIFDAMRIILKTTHYDIATMALMNCSEDLQTVEEWLAENIPKEYKKLEDIERAFDYLSKADIFLGRVYKRQYFGLWRFASSLMTAGVALAKDEKYRGFTKYSYPSVLTLLTRTKAKRETLKKILKKIGEKTHTSSKRARDDLELLKSIIENNLEMGAELVEYFEITKEELENIVGKKLASEVFKIINKKKKEKEKEKKIKEKAEKKIEVEQKETEEIKVEKIEEVKEEKKSKGKKTKKSEKKEEKTKQLTLEAFFK